MKKAAIYCRVSTDEQATEGLSIPAQKKALLSFAQDNRFEVVRAFVDEGASAKTAQRPEFQRMIAEAKLKPRPFDTILVHKTDRFTRNREDAVIYKSLLRRECSVDVVSVTERFEDTPTGRLLEGMMEVIAEFYSMNLAQEVKKGMKERAAMGKAMGLAPFGYRVGPEGKMEVMEDEAQVVSFIFNLYVKESLGLLNIAQTLHAQGYARFGEAGARHKWSAAGIRNIITNPVYTGTFVWNRRDTAKQRVLREKSHWIVVDDAHPPIIDKALFEAANEILRQRAGNRKNLGKPRHIFRGIARCMDCGGSMSYFAMSWTRKNGEKVIKPKLTCSRYHHSKSCYFNHVDLQEAETLLFNQIRQLLGGRVQPSDLEISIDPSNGKKQSKILQGKKRDLESRFQRLVEAYETGIIDLDEFGMAKERLAGERHQLEERLRENQGPPEGDREAEDTVRKVVNPDTALSLPVARRHAVLGQMVDKIEYSRRQNLFRIVFSLHEPAHT